MFLHYFSIKKGDTVIILGAHQGGDIPFFHRKVGEEGLIIAVEPMKENYVFIEKLILEKEYENVKLFKGVISDKNGETKIHLGTNTVNHSLIKDWKQGKRVVESITWNALMNLYNIEKVKLTLIDVEGAEEQVMKGMTKTYPKYILAETHEHLGVNKEPFLRQLRKKHYEYYEKKKMYVYATLDEEYMEKLEKYVIPPYRKLRTFPKPTPYFDVARKRTRKIIKDFKPESILDVGCGVGKDYINLSKICKKYVGVDPIEANLKVARKRHPSGDFRVAFAQELPFPDNSFDVVYMSGVWENLPKEYMDLGIKECIRVASKAVINLDATKKPRLMTERYMSVPLILGLEIRRMNYDLEKKKANYVWVINVNGIK
jgi:FkbM family methyltransferase